LLGNGELALFLDENGVMHDFAAFPGWPSPRIYWAGRRLDNRARTMAPFGLFSLGPGWEWMESTKWSQRLDVHRGLVTTEHERGIGSEQTQTLLLLDRNIIAVHKRVNRVRGSGQAVFTYRLCPPLEMGLPAGTMLTGGGDWPSGGWLGYRLDGVTTYNGRAAIWADRDVAVARRGNELRLTAKLNNDHDEVTFYLALADDLGDDLLYRQCGWGGSHAGHPMLAPIIKDLHNRLVTHSDPQAQIEQWRQWTASAGWAGVAAHQAALWGKFFASGWLSLPDAPNVQAIWETGMYAVRSQLTRWSIPVAIHGNYFNGQYFWDETAGARALLQAGHWPLVRRMAEHKLSVVPLGMQMVDGAGARGDAASFEGGYFNVAPAGSSVYEVHATEEPPRLIWTWLQYAGLDRDAATLTRYYPVFWGAAEFFRRWMVYKGPDGKYFTGACVDANESVPAVTNGAATVAGAIGSTALAALAAEQLGRDEHLVPLWREIAAGLQGGVRTNRRGLLCQHEGDEGVSFTCLRLVATPFSIGTIPPDDPRVRRSIEACVNDCKTRENWAVAASHDPELAAHSQDVNNPDPIAWTWPPAEAVGVAAFLHDGSMACRIIDELVRCSNNFASLYECKVMTDG